MSKTRNPPADETWDSDDWTQITEPALRKRVQNRLSQRKHRAKKRQNNQPMLLEVGTPSGSSIAPKTNEQSVDAINESTLQFTSQRDIPYSKNPGTMLDGAATFDWANFQARDDLVLDDNGLVVNSGAGWPQQPWNMVNNGIQDVPVTYNMPHSHTVSSQGYSSPASQSTMGDQVTPFDPSMSYDVNGLGIYSERSQCTCRSGPYSCNLGEGCVLPSGRAGSTELHNTADLANSRTTSGEWHHAQIDQFSQNIGATNFLPPSHTPDRMDQNDISNANNRQFYD